MINYLLEDSNANAVFQAIKDNRQKPFLFQNKYNSLIVPDKQLLHNISLARLRESDISLYQETVKLPVNKFLGELPDGSLADLINKVKLQNKSLKLLNVNYFCRLTNELKRRLELYFQSHITINLYASFKNAGVLQRHKDPYDILIFQLSGKKQWIFDDHDITLNEGDVLFLPKYCYHFTKAIGESVHFTVGLHFPNLFYLSGELESDQSFWLKQDTNSCQIDAGAMIDAQKNIIHSPQALDSLEQSYHRRRHGLLINTTNPTEVHEESIKLNLPFKLNASSIIDYGETGESFFIESIDSLFKLNKDREGAQEIFEYVLNYPILEFSHIINNFKLSVTEATTMIKTLFHKKIIYQKLV